MRLLKQGKVNVNDVTKPYKLRCPKCDATFLVDCIDDIQVSKQKTIERAANYDDILFDCDIMCTVYVECPWCNNKLYFYDYYDHFEVFYSKWHKLMNDVHKVIKDIVIYTNNINTYFGDETSMAITEFKNVCSELKAGDT